MDPQTAPTPTPETQLSPVPDLWPGGFGAYKYSKAAVKTNLSTIVGLLVVTFAFSIVGGAHGRTPALSLIVDIVSIFISGAMTYVYIASVKRSKVSFGVALDHGVRVFLKYFLTLLLMAVALAISIILLVVPFFFVLPRLVLAPYFMIDQNLSPVEALKASWEQTKGHAGKVWGIIGVTFLIALLVVTIIGIPFAAYFYTMYSAATAVLYGYLLDHPTAVAVTTTAAPPAAS